MIVLLLSIVLLVALSVPVHGSVWNESYVQALPVSVEPPKVILQSGTAGTSTIYTNSTSAKVNVAAPTNWWDLNYGYRKQISVVNDAVSTLSSGYSVCLTIDTALLVSEGKMLSSGNDLRIAYWNGSGWTELDRDLIDMGTTSTQVWFKTQAAIEASGSDSSYYMYYGYSGAVNPPANKSNVYIWFDDFSTNTLDNYDQAKWVDIHGNGYVPPTYDAVNERVWFDTGDNYASDMYPKGVVEADFLMEVDFWANGSYPYDATIALVGRLENPGTSSTHYYLDFSHGQYDSPGITVDSWINGERSNTVYSEPSDYYWSFDTVHTFRYAIFGSTHKFWWNSDISQPPNVTATDSLHTAAGRIGLAPAQVRGWWDNFKIRKYIEPEPSTYAGSEETLNYDYVLKVVNQVADDWKVNLRVYGSSNIGRLLNATIGLYDGTSSDQIVVSGGVITQSEGALYDLAGSATIYINISDLQATTSGTSYLYVYLKILVPGTSVYHLFVITFEIT